MSRKKVGKNQTNAASNSVSAATSVATTQGSAGAPAQAQETVTPMAPSAETVAAAKEQLPEDMQKLVAESEKKMTEEQALAIVKLGKEHELKEFLKQNEQYMSNARLESQLILDAYNEQCQARLKSWQSKEIEFIDNLDATGQQIIKERVQSLNQMLEKSSEKALDSFSQMIDNQTKMLEDHFSERLLQMEEMQKSWFKSSLKNIESFQSDLKDSWEHMTELKQQSLQDLQAKLDEREQTLELKAKALNEQKANLDAFAKDLNKRVQEFSQYENKTKQELTRREQILTQSEETYRSKLEADFAAYRKQLEDEFNKKTKDLEHTFANKENQHSIKVTAFNNTKKSWEVQSSQEKQDWESKRQQQEHEWSQKCKEQQHQFDLSIKDRLQELDDREFNLLEREQELEISQKALTRDKQSQQTLLKEQLKTYGGQRLNELTQSLRASEAMINSLKEQLNIATKRQASTDVMMHQFGDRAPETVLSDLKNYKEKVAELQNKLANLPAAEVGARVSRLEQENQELQAKLSEKSQECRKNQEMVEKAYDSELELTLKRKEIESLNQQNLLLDTSNKQLKSELERFHAQQGTGLERDQRIEVIERAYINVTNGAEKFFDAKMSEIEWLENIVEKCRDYEFVFPKRSIYAFHTSMKCSEWSPITVLAGVSGTGKSELPRLYSKFGGINFMLLAVQSNWDCQEAMLGYFNSIDNVFEAQPVLRFLAQTQKERQDDYPGLKNQMNLILLDEMNLSHIELYFAEFLSKLEFRRGKNKNELPILDVKLGSGFEPYKLPLDRNVLWAGTMNQDETTKALSDKVIDRSNVLYFPRPTSLISRRNLSETAKIKEEQVRLNANTWKAKWVNFDINFGNEIDEYKLILEEINLCLTEAGRALGHRVWQSIENYLANYPTVKQAQVAHNSTKLKQAMHIAFEDQLVMKVMPKLRGIETRGRTRDLCLDRIGKLLEDQGFDNLKSDFEQACNSNYGQFLWNSASYLDRDGDEVALS